MNADDEEALYNCLTLLMDKINALENRVNEIEYALVGKEKELH